MNIQQQIVDKIRKSNSEFAIIPSPDFNHRKEIERRIKENDGYCCCALEKTEDTKCMCKEFREQQKSGFCHCGRFYKIHKSLKVCLCGSTKFKPIFESINRDLTLLGCIVEMPGVFIHAGEDATPEEKIRLDELHKAKIADCDLIFVINKGGYIGQSTGDEIEWALSLNKEIIYLE